MDGFETPKAFEDFKWAKPLALTLNWPNLTFEVFDAFIESKLSLGRVDLRILYEQSHSLSHSTDLTDRHLTFEVFDAFIESKLSKD